MKHSIHLSIGPVAGEGHDLFSSAYEYATAVTRLSARPAVQVRVPDAVFLSLYAYEVVERSREALLTVTRETVWRVPFWPEALFAAAAVRAHPWRELEAMLPEFASVTVTAAPAAATEAAALRVLGALRFLPEDYQRSLREICSRRGWLER